MSDPEIQTGAPVKRGTYVAYINHDLPNYARRVLLFWDRGWVDTLSGKRFFREHVYGWIGPLPAMPL